MTIIGTDNFATSRMMDCTEGSARESVTLPYEPILDYKAPVYTPLYMSAGSLVRCGLFLAAIFTIGALDRYMPQSEHQKYATAIYSSEEH